MKPPTTTRYMLTLVGVLIAGGAAGYATGRLQDMGHRLGGLAEMHAGELAFHVETLSLLRMGDTEGAVRTLETLVDGEIGIVAQPGQIPLAGLSDCNRKVLGLAKAYRRKYPSSNAAVQESLRDVPAREFRNESKCDSATCRLLRPGGNVRGPQKDGETQSQQPSGADPAGSGPVQP